MLSIKNFILIRPKAESENSKVRLINVSTLFSGNKNFKFKVDIHKYSVTLSQDLKYHPLHPLVSRCNFYFYNVTVVRVSLWVEFWRPSHSLGFVTWTQTSLICQEGSLNSAASPDTRFYLLSVFAASILRSWSGQQHYYKKCTVLGHECLELLRHEASIIH